MFVLDNTTLISIDKPISLSNECQFEVVVEEEFGINQFELCLEQNTTKKLKLNYIVSKFNLIQFLH